MPLRDETKINVFKLSAFINNKLCIGCVACGKKCCLNDQLIKNDKSVQQNCIIYICFHTQTFLLLSQKHACCFIRAHIESGQKVSLTCAVCVIVLAKSGCGAPNLVWHGSQYKKPTRYKFNNNAGQEFVRLREKKSHIMNKTYC